MGATFRIDALLHCFPHWPFTFALQNLTFSQCVFEKCFTNVGESYSQRNNAKSGTDPHHFLPIQQPLSGDRSDALQQAQSLLCPARAVPPC
jgi:hypothetical protein